MNKLFPLTISLMSFCLNAMDAPDGKKQETQAVKQQLVTLQKAVFCRDIKPVLCNLLSHEKSSIKGAYYSFELPELAKPWAEQKKEHTIAGGLIVHDHEKPLSSAITTLLLHGVPVRKAHVRQGYRFGNMHHKFLCLPNTVDGKKLVVTGSFNATAAADATNYEDLVIIEDPEVYKTFEAEFDLIWNDNSSPVRGGKKDKSEILEYPEVVEVDAERLPRAAFSPGIKEVLKTLIGHEKRSFQAATFRFNLYDVAQAWADKHKELSQKAGHVKEVSALLVDKTFNQETPQALKLLVASGVPVKELSNATGIMHHKFFVFSNNKNDKPVLVVGSYNPTGNAEKANWENIVVTDDADTFNAYKKHLMKLFAQSALLPKAALDYTKKVSTFVADMNEIPRDKR